MDPVLLAVAVHDDEGRLEDAGIDQIASRAGESRVFRISYRLVDSPKAKDEAQVTVAFRLDGGEWVHLDAELVDRPMVRDDKQGFLDFTTPPLAEGEHILEYQVRFKDSQTSPGGGSRERSEAVDGRVAIQVS